MRRAQERARPAFSWLPLIGLIPAFLLAVWSLTQPWARGRAMLVWGISRSPGAAVLVAVTLAAMVGASVAAATRGRRRDIAAIVHIASGFLMVAVALAAFSMIQHAPTKLFGLVPLATIRPAVGLYAFLWAAVLVVALGVVEGTIWWRTRQVRAVPPDAPPAPTAPPAPSPDPPPPNTVS